MLAIYHPAPVIADPRPYDEVQACHRQAVDQTRAILQPHALPEHPARSARAVVRLPRVRQASPTRSCSTRPEPVVVGRRRAQTATSPTPRWTSTPASRLGRRCSSIPGPAARALSSQLLKAFGGPAEVLAASRASLAAIRAADVASAIARGATPDELEPHARLARAARPCAAARGTTPDYPAPLLAIGRSAAGAPVTSAGASC